MRPSHNLPLPPRIYPFIFSYYMRPSQNLPLLPRIYPPFQHLYVTLPESTPPSQNILHFQHLCATLPESTPPSKNIPPFSTNICDPPRIYPLPFLLLYATLLESTPPSQNIPPFSTNICDPPRIYPSLTEYTPSLFSYYIRLSQNLPLPPRIYPPFLHLCATLPKSTPPSQNIPPPFLLFSYYYATFPESTPPSQNIPPFSTPICDSLRIYPSLPEHTPSLFSYCMQPSQNLNPLPEYPPFSTTILLCDPSRI